MLLDQELGGCELGREGKGQLDRTTCKKGTWVSGPEAVTQTLFLQVDFHMGESCEHFISEASGSTPYLESLGSKAGRPTCLRTTWKNNWEMFHGQE